MMIINLFNLWLIVGLFLAADAYSPKPEDCQIGEENHYRVKYTYSDSEMVEVRDSLLRLLVRFDEASGDGHYLVEGTGEDNKMKPYPFAITYDSEKQEISKCTAISDEKNTEIFAQSLASRIPSLSKLDAWQQEESPAPTEEACFTNGEGEKACFIEVEGQCTLASYESKDYSITVKSMELTLRDATIDNYIIHGSMKCDIGVREWITDLKFSMRSEFRTMHRIPSDQFMEKEDGRSIEIFGSLSEYKKYSFVEEKSLNAQISYMSDYESGIRYKRAVLDTQEAASCEAVPIYNDKLVDTMDELVEDDLKGVLYGRPKDGWDCYFSGFVRAGTSVTPRYVLRTDEFSFFGMRYKGVTITLHAGIEEQGSELIVIPKRLKIWKDFEGVEKMDEFLLSPLSDLNEVEFLEKINGFQLASCMENQFAPRFKFTMDKNLRVTKKDYDKGVPFISNSIKEELTRVLHDNEVPFSSSRISTPLFELETKENQTRLVIFFAIYELPSIKLFFRPPKKGSKFPDLPASRTVKTVEDCMRDCYFDKACTTLTYDSKDHKCYLTDNFFSPEDLEQADPNFVTTGFSYRSLNRQLPTRIASKTLRNLKLPAIFEIKVSSDNNKRAHKVLTVPMQTQVFNPENSNMVNKVFKVLDPAKKFTAYANIKMNTSFFDCSKLALHYIDLRKTIGFMYEPMTKMCSLGFSPVIAAKTDSQKDFIYTSKNLFDRIGVNSSYSLDILEKYYHKYLHRIPTKVENIDLCSKACLDSTMLGCAAVFYSKEDGLCIISSINKFKAGLMGKDDQVPTGIMLDLYMVNAKLAFGESELLPNIPEALIEELKLVTPGQTDPGFECLGTRLEDKKPCNGYALCYQDHVVKKVGLMSDYVSWYSNATSKDKKPGPYLCRVYKREFMNDIGKTEVIETEKVIVKGPSKGAIAGSTVGLFVAGTIIGGVIMKVVSS